MPSTTDSLLARIERCAGCGCWRFWLDRYPCTICIEYWKDK